MKAETPHSEHGSPGTPGYPRSGSRAWEARGTRKAGHGFATGYPA